MFYFYKILKNFKQFFILDVMQLALAKSGLCYTIKYEKKGKVA